MDESVEKLDEVSKTKTSQMDELMAELLNKSKEDLAGELYAFYRVWDCIDEETKYLLSNIAQMFSITQRNYNTKVGILTKVFFEPKRFFISVYEKLFDGGAGKYIWDSKEWSVLANMVIAYAVIHEREVED